MHKVPTRIDYHPLNSAIGPPNTGLGGDGLKYDKQIIVPFVIGLI